MGSDYEVVHNYNFWGNYSYCQGTTIVNICKIADAKKQDEKKGRREIVKASRKLETVGGKIHDENILCLWHDVMWKRNMILTDPLISSVCVGRWLSLIEHKGISYIIMFWFCKGISYLTILSIETIHQGRSLLHHA